MTSPNTPVDIEAVKASSSSGAELESSASPAHTIGESFAGWERLTDAQRADIEAHVRGLTDDAETYDPPRYGWTCFHCGETFRTTAGARLHFGAMVTGRPVCCEFAVAERVIRETVKMRWERDPGGGGGYVISEESARKAVAEIARLSSEAPPIGAAGVAEAALSATDELIARLKDRAGEPGRFGYSPDLQLLADTATALSRLLAERREMLEALKKITEGDYRIISGSPGPLFDAGWSACAASFVERLRALLSASPEGKGE